MKPRSIQKTADMLRKVSLNEDSVEDFTEDWSMIPITTIWSEFQMIGLLSCANLYLEFQCEPMHTCSDGMSTFFIERMCKFDVERLYAEDIEYDNLQRCSWNSQRSKESVLNADNRFIRRVEQWAVCYGLYDDSPKTDRTDKINRYFTVTRLKFQASSFQPSLLFKVEHLCTFPTDPIDFLSELLPWVVSLAQTKSTWMILY